MVSFIIPNHNKAAFLAETIQSLLSQTIGDWVAIFVDDGSTDDSLKIIQEYSIKDNRISLVALEKQKNASVCRNIGITNAEGDYVIFMDSDDVLEANCLETRINILKENPKLDFAVFGMGTFYEKIGDSNSYWIPIQEQALEKFYSHDLPWQTMQPIYRKTFIEKNNLNFDEQLPRLQDVDFHTQILQLTPKFHVFPKIVDCYYRISAIRKVVHPESFYENYVFSMNRYYFKFQTSYSQKYLNLTLLQGISILVNANQQNELSSKSVLNQKRNLLENVGGSVFIVLNLYAQIGVFLSVHIPGMRFIFKKLLKVLG